MGPLQIHTGSCTWDFKSCLKIGLTFHGNMTAEKARVKAWEEKGACRIRESSLFSLSSGSHLNLLVMSTAAGKHLRSWKGITVPLVALLTRVPPIQPSPSSPTQPIHHAQNASHRLSSSPAGRRKIDLFVYVCKEGPNEQGAAKKKKKRERQRYELGRTVAEVCVYQRFTPAVSQASRWTSSQTTCLLSCRVHSPISACLPV